MTTISAALSGESPIAQGSAAVLPRLAAVLCMFSGHAFPITRLARVGRIARRPSLRHAKISQPRKQSRERE